MSCASRKGTVSRAFGLASALLSASCAVSPTTENVPLIEQISAGNQCVYPGALDIDPSLDPAQYTIDATAVPRFSLSGGPVYGRSNVNAFIIASELDRATGCDTWAIVWIVTDDPAAIEILPVEDWRAVAGEAAVDTLDQLVADCIALPPEDAFSRFGDDRMQDPRFNRAAFQTRDDTCRMAVQSLAYGLRVRSPDGEVVVSNVFGQFFIEDLAT